MVEPMEPDFRPGEMSDEEAEALLDHSMAVLNEMRAANGLPPIEWADDESTED